MTSSPAPILGRVDSASDTESTTARSSVSPHASEASFPPVRCCHRVHPRRLRGRRWQPHRATIELRELRELRLRGARCELRRRRHELGSGSADTTAPNFSGSGGEEFCAQAKGFEDTFGSNDAFGQSSDPAQLKDDFSKAQDALKQLESSAPDEIKADVKTVSEAMSSLISVFESANYDFTKLAEDPAALAKLESFDSQEVQDASTRIEAYFSQVCGISTTDTTP